MTVTGAKISIPVEKLPVEGRRKKANMLAF